MPAPSSVRAPSRDTLKFLRDAILYGTLGTTAGAGVLLLEERRRMIGYFQTIAENGRRLRAFEGGRVRHRSLVEGSEGDVDEVVASKEHMVQSAFQGRDEEKEIAHVRRRKRRRRDSMDGHSRTSTTKRDNAVREKSAERTNTETKTRGPKTRYWYDEVETPGATNTLRGAGMNLTAGASDALQSTTRLLRGLLLPQDQFFKTSYPSKPSGKRPHLREAGHAPAFCSARDCHMPSRTRCFGTDARRRGGVEAALYAEPDWMPPPVAGESFTVRHYEDREPWEVGPQECTGGNNLDRQNLLNPAPAPSDEFPSLESSASAEEKPESAFVSTQGEKLRQFSSQLVDIEREHGKFTPSPAAAKACRMLTVAAAKGHWPEVWQMIRDSAEKTNLEDGQTGTRNELYAAAVQQFMAHPTGFASVFDFFSTALKETGLPPDEHTCNELVKSLIRTRKIEHISPLFRCLQQLNPELRLRPVWVYYWLTNFQEHFRLNEETLAELVRDIGYMAPDLLHGRLRGMFRKMEVRPISSLPRHNQKTSVDAALRASWEQSEPKVRRESKSQFKPLQQVTTDMKLALARGDNDMAIASYESLLANSGMDAAFDAVKVGRTALELAVEASCRRERGSLSHATTLIKRSAVLGIPIRDGKTNLLNHRIMAKKVPLKELQRRVMDEYQAREKAGLVPKHYFAVSAGVVFVEAGHPRLAVKMLEEIRKSRYHWQTPFGIEVWSSYIVIFAKLHDLKGIQWCLDTIRERDVIIDWHIVDKIKGTNGMVRNIVPQHEAAVKPLIRGQFHRWRTELRELWDYQRARVRKMGDELVAEILKLYALQTDPDVIQQRLKVSSDPQVQVPFTPAISRPSMTSSEREQIRTVDSSSGAQLPERTEPNFIRKIPLNTTSTEERHSGALTAVPNLIVSPMSSYRSYRRLPTRTIFSREQVREYGTRSCTKAELHETDLKSGKRTGRKLVRFCKPYAVDDTIRFHWYQRHTPPPVYQKPTSLPNQQPSSNPGQETDLATQNLDILKAGAGGVMHNPAGPKQGAAVHRSPVQSPTEPDRQLEPMRQSPSDVQPVTVLPEGEETERRTNVRLTKTTVKNPAPVDEKRKLHWCWLNQRKNENIESIPVEPPYLAISRRTTSEPTLSTAREQALSPSPETQCDETIESTARTPLRPSRIRVVQTLPVRKIRKVSFEARPSSKRRRLSLGADFPLERQPMQGDHPNSRRVDDKRQTRRPRDPNSMRVDDKWRMRRRREETDLRNRQPAVYLMNLDGVTLEDNFWDQMPLQVAAAKRDNGEELPEGKLQGSQPAEGEQQLGDSQRPDNPRQLEDERPPGGSQSGVARVQHDKTLWCPDPRWPAPEREFWTQSTSRVPITGKA